MPARPPAHARRVVFLAAIATAALAGCQADVNLHGNLPSRDEIAQIHPGKTTKAQVTTLLGSPSSVGVFDPNHWFYISRRTRRVAFFDPTVLDQQVYVVDFNKDGVVERVRHMGLKQAQNIEPAPGKTPAPGRHLTFLEQLIGNVGRFNGVSTPGSKNGS